jgi:NAD(P)-dependent dehydrogenase (short-subunit alcohol dehydrogenase family)
MRLQQRTALVTGASRGIGNAIALALAREGADLVITARIGNDLRDLSSSVTAMGRQCLVVEADLASPGAVDHIWQEAQRGAGPVDILVNNAGVGSGIKPRPVVDFDDQAWDLTLRMNLTVPYLMCKRALPGMIARRYGRLIAIASINAFRGGVHDAAYTSSKAGLVGLTRTLAREHVRDGITSNAICPGTTATRTADTRLQYDAERLGRPFEALIAGIGPLGRRLEPEEIAPIAVYLASAESAATTGQTFVIDGGQLNA